MATAMDVVAAMTLPQSSGVIDKECQFLERSLPIGPASWAENSKIAGWVSDTQAKSGLTLRALQAFEWAPCSDCG
jgi:hypothetical protein